MTLYDDGNNLIKLFYFYCIQGQASSVFELICKDYLLAVPKEHKLIGKGSSLK